jgi:hypothetical protein
MMAAIEDYRNRIAIAEAIVGDFDPSQLSGVVSWIDFQDLSTMFGEAALTTPVTGTGQSVGAVVDKISGQVGVSGISNKPLSTDIGVVLSASLELYKFGAAMNDVIFAAGADLNIFAVHKPNTTGGTQQIISSSYNAVGFSLKVAAGNLDADIGNGAGTYANHFGVDTLVAGATQLAEFSFDNAANTFGTNINDTTISTTAFTADCAPQPGDVVAIGANATASNATNYYGGEISEIIICQSITPEERALLMDYFALKHGITL